MSTNTLVIAHGKTEMVLCHRISNLLRMPMVIVSRDRGEEAITISQLPTMLSTGPFSSEYRLHKAHPELGYNPRGKVKMPDLRIFTLMDVDMDRSLLKSYVSRDLFRDSPFRDRIVPVVNDPNMDVVMEEIGMGSVQIKKTRSYARMVDGIEDPLDFLRRLEGSDSTSMDQFVRHCLSCSPPYQHRI